MNKEIARKRRGARNSAIVKMSTRPRLVVHRSNKYIYASVVQEGKTLAAASSMKIEGNKCSQASVTGKLLAERALKANIKEVAFDRSGYKYHGRVKALADGAREAGLIF